MRFDLIESVSEGFPSYSLSLYRAVSQREGERGEKGQTRVEMSNQPNRHLLQAQ